ncbi:MAG: hypothetical protein HYZ27_08565, partial [Deltaproteobacteria bacterium]|nr:hypothetical protein [Deltaproteobacteria bacterium]
AVGHIELALCDRGTVCGCEVLLPTSAAIDFGSPAVGGVSRRTLRIRNLELANRLTISALRISQGESEFGVTGVQHRASEASNAEVESVPLGSEIVLQGEEVADVLLAFQPTVAGPLSGTLVVSSNSSTSPSFSVQLTGGGGSATTCIPSGDCGDGSTIDFGTFTDDQVGPDLADPMGRPLALGASVITVTNTGATEAFVGVTLTHDGIPEGPGELPGERGVFFLEQLGCSVVGAGESLAVSVEYRPSTAGEHVGEVVVTGAGAPVHIPLLGRVIGAHICFRTEDDRPQDSTLQFGDPPAYTTAANVSETRRAWVGNCGFQEDLVVTDMRVGAANSAFTSSAMPWTQTAPIPPGSEVEVPVMFSPSTAPGSFEQGTYLFDNNDRFVPAALLNLSARVGEPEQCILVATPSPVDFGWVAADEESQGCDPA